MNYLDFVTKYQSPSQPLPSTGDEEKDRKLMRAYELYAKDQPLSGTDPLGEFYVSGVALGPAFSSIGKGLTILERKLFPKAITRNLKKFIGTQTGPKLVEQEVNKLPKELQEQIKLLQQEGIDITQFSRWDLEKAIKGNPYQRMQERILGQL